MLQLDSVNEFDELMDKKQKHLDSLVDPVNHPSHYQGSIECIDAIESAMTPEAFKGYLRGNALKYLWRSGKKGVNTDWITDLKKASWYINKLIECYEEESRQSQQSKSFTVLGDK